MGTSKAAVHALVDYDRRVAEDVLRLVARELGVDERRRRALHARLTNLPAADGAESTQEWKLDFGQLERPRALALALAESIPSPARTAL
jgi:hypothetical protein